VAATAIGIPELHPHELRHTAASLATASGADVKVVQQMLGHSSAAMTMDVYGHLFSDRLDEVADALDNARSEAARLPVLLPTLKILLPKCCQTPMWSTWPPTRRK
jgi:site-specific recombinase XerC